MPHHRSVVALCLGLALAWVPFGCSGGGGSTNPPTAPPRSPNNQLILQVIFNVAPIGGGIGGTQEAALLLDGVEVGRGDWSALAGGCAGGCSIVATVRGVSEGSHVATLRPVRQSFQTMRYLLGGAASVTDFDSGQGSQTTFQARSVDLRVGQSVEFSFDV